MTKLTLEDASSTLKALAAGMRADGEGVAALSAEQQALLVRAAAEVIEAVKMLDWIPHTNACPATYERPQGCTCGADHLAAKMDVYEQISEGVEP